MPTVIILSGVAWFTFYSYQKFLGDLAIKQYPELIQHPPLFKTQTGQELLDLNGILTGFF